LAGGFYTVLLLRRDFALSGSADSRREGLDRKREPNIIKG
jgi:hypothetical protein